MTVIVVISILIVMVFGVTTNFQRRADRANCVANLTNLYAAANVYIQHHGSWPQVDYKLLQTEERRYAEAWVDALKPCGTIHKNWLCPTIQRELGNPDMNNPKDMRIDYIANPFDDRMIAPFEFSNQPWFAERGDPHGEGNLVILTNGQILTLRDLIPKK